MYSGHLPLPEIPSMLILIRVILLCGLIISLITPQGHAQSISLTGRVTDKQSGEDLIGAHIFLKEHDIGIVTNRYGHFTVNIPPADSIRLTVSFLGYQKLDTVLYPKHPGQMVEFSLTEQITTLLSVNVTAKYW